MIKVITNQNAWPEKVYVFTVILKHFLQIPFQMIEKRGEATMFHLPNNRWLKMPDTFREDGTSTVIEHQWLTHTLTDLQELPIIGGTNQLKWEEEGLYCGIDIAASVFFMLSRWEEANAEKDVHGRASADSALAVRMNFIHRPVVQMYTRFLCNLLNALEFRLKWPDRGCQLIPTHDIDHPRLWWNPINRIKTLGGALFRRQSLSELGYWLNYRGMDPFDTTSWLMNISARAGLTSRFYYLGERARDANCYYPLRHPLVMNDIYQILEQGHQLGIHPSYESASQTNLLMAEKESLEAVSGISISHARQHYLRFNLSSMVCALEEAGITEDSSLGYPELSGFRCGSCWPFPLYNYVEKRISTVWESPLIAMDVSEALYRKMSVEQSFDYWQMLAANVKKYGGNMVVLWHNSSVNDYFWHYRKNAYEAFLREF